MRNFIVQTPWCEGEDERETGKPGTTWLELYILFKMHCNKKPAEQLLRKKLNLQNELASFKKMCREVGSSCICEE